MLIFHVNIQTITNKLRDVCQTLTSDKDLNFDYFGAINSSVAMQQFQVIFTSLDVL